MNDEEYEDPLSLAKGIIKTIPCAIAMWIGLVYLIVWLWRVL